MGLNIQTSDIERNFMKDRINHVQKNFTEISSKLSSYNNKLASLRDCGDDLAKSVSQFASEENYNHTLRLSLGEFSDVLKAIEEYRDAQIQRTQIKVIREIESYIPLCKKTKVDMKKYFDARMKELKKKNDLEKARCKNPSNWQKIAEKEVSQAQEDAVRMTQELGRLVEWFERKKLEDMKNAFIEFIRIEMIFHAKALELYSKSYNIIKKIKVEEDLHEFQSHFLAHLSSLDAEAISPAKSSTTPIVLDSEVPAHQSETLKGIPGTSRSIFTLKAATTYPDKPGSSCETLNDTIE